MIFWLALFQNSYIYLELNKVYYSIYDLVLKFLFRHSGTEMYTTEYTKFYKTIIMVNNLKWLNLVNGGKIVQYWISKYSFW